jgi:hypothetical protein
MCCLFPAVAAWFALDEQSDQAAIALHRHLVLHRPTPHAHRHQQPGSLLPCTLIRPAGTVTPPSLLSPCPASPQPTPPAILGGRSTTVSRVRSSRQPSLPAGSTLEKSCQGASLLRVLFQPSHLIHTPHTRCSTPTLGSRSSHDPRRHERARNASRGATASHGVTTQTNSSTGTITLCVFSCLLNLPSQWGPVRREDVLSRRSRRCSCEPRLFFCDNSMHPLLGPRSPTRPGP